MRLDLSGAEWRKSSRSSGVSGGGDQCVEVALVPGGAGVRDSKNRQAGHLEFSPSAWSAFVRDIKAGRYDM